MRKTFKIVDIDCANCAREIEEAIKKIEGVDFVSLNFMSERLIIEAEESIFDDVIKKAQKCAKRVEADCKITPVKL